MLERLYTRWERTLSMGARFLEGSKFGARKQVLGEFGGSCSLDVD